MQWMSDPYPHVNSNLNPVRPSQVLRVMPGGQQAVEEADGIDALEAIELQSHPQLQTAAARLVDTYFGEDYGL